MAKKAKTRVNGIREPNGRLSRKQGEIAKRLGERFKDMDSEERQTIAPGIEARQRVHGLPFEQAASPMASTFIGRLCMNREVSALQYEAATLYVEDCENYSRAIQSPKQPGAVDLNATKGIDNYENVERTRHIIAKMDGDKARNIPGIRPALQAAQNELRGNASLFAALYEIVLRDRECYHLVGDAKLALNCLVRFYGLTGERKAA